MDIFTPETPILGGDFHDTFAGLASEWQERHARREYLGRMYDTLSPDDPRTDKVSAEYDEASDRARTCEIHLGFLLEFRGFKGATHQGRLLVDATTPDDPMPRLIVIPASEVAIIPNGENNELATLAEAAMNWKQYRSEAEESGERLDSLGPGDFRAIIEGPIFTMAGVNRIQAAHALLDAMKAKGVQAVMVDGSVVIHKPFLDPELIPNVAAQEPELVEIPLSKIHGFL
jgi:hypothetical protein